MELLVLRSGWIHVSKILKDEGVYHEVQSRTSRYRRMDPRETTEDYDRDSIKDAVLGLGHDDQMKQTAKLYAAQSP